MTVVAADLSKHCDLTVYADKIWVGGGCVGLGMVFMGVNMGDDVRTPEDDEKLKKLEEKLVELKLMTPPKLEILCSSSYPPHTEEPFEMTMLPPPEGPEWKISRLAKYWRSTGHDKKVRREKGAAKIL